MKLSLKQSKNKKSAEILTYQELTEDQGESHKTHQAVDDAGRVLAEFVTKDGKPYMASATQDVQDSGKFKKLANKAGFKGEVSHTTATGMALDAEKKSNKNEKGSKIKGVSLLKKAKLPAGIRKEREGFVLDYSQMKSPEPDLPMWKNKVLARKETHPQLKTKKAEERVSLKAKPENDMKKALDGSRIKIMFEKVKNKKPDYNKQVEDRARQIKEQYRDKTEPTLEDQIAKIKGKYKHYLEGSNLKKNDEEETPGVKLLRERMKQKKEIKPGSTSQKIREALSRQKGTNPFAAPASSSSFRERRDEVNPKFKAAIERQESGEFTKKPRKHSLVHPEISNIKIAPDAPSLGPLDELYIKFHGKEMLPHNKNTYRFEVDKDRSVNIGDKNVSHHEIDGNHYFRVSGGKPHRSRYYVITNDKKIKHIPSEPPYYYYYDPEFMSESQLEERYRDYLEGRAKGLAASINAVKKHPKYQEILRGIPADKAKIKSTAKEKKADFDEKIARKRASLDKINKLMADLKSQVKHAEKREDLFSEKKEEKSPKQFGHLRVIKSLAKAEKLNKPFGNPMGYADSSVMPITTPIAPSLAPVTGMGSLAMSEKFKKLKKACYHDLKKAKKDNKFERCVQDVKQQNKEKGGSEKSPYNPWAVCHASLGKADDPKSFYEQHRKESDLKATQKSKPTLLRSYELEDEHGMPSGEKFHLFLATHPDHEAMIGYHHRLNKPFDKTKNLPDEVERSMEDAINQGFDRMFLHAPEHKGAKKKIGHLSLMKSKNLNKNEMLTPIKPSISSVDTEEQKNKPQVPSTSNLTKDNMPHPMNSPKDLAHDAVEDKKPIKEIYKTLEGSKEKMQRMFAHMRKYKTEGESWKRSPENKEIGEGKMEKGWEPWMSE